MSRRKLAKERTKTTQVSDRYSVQLNKTVVTRLIWEWSTAEYDGMDDEEAEYEAGYKSHKDHLFQFKTFENVSHSLKYACCNINEESTKDCFFLSSYRVSLKRV